MSWILEKRPILHLVWLEEKMIQNKESVIKLAVKKQVNKLSILEENDSYLGEYVCCSKNSKSQDSWSSESSTRLQWHLQRILDLTETTKKNAT